MTHATLHIGNLLLAVTDAPLPVPARASGSLTLQLRTVATDAPLRPEAPPLVEMDSWAAFSSPGLLSFVGKSAQYRPIEVARVDLRPGGSEGTVLYRSDLREQPFIYPLDQLVVIHMLEQSGGLLMHGAALAGARGGFLVAGPSGAGKTTLSQAFAPLDGARVLTDERAVVRPGPGGWLLDGTPFCGAGFFAEDATVPLRGVLLLDQAEEDRLVPLTPARALAMLLRCHFPAVWRPSALETALGRLEQLVRDVPCMLLRNRRGGEAPRLVLDLVERLSCEVPC